MPLLKIKRVWTDDDEMVQLEVTASNDAQVTKQDFYIYPKELASFGKELRSFPKTLKDEVRLEYGEDPKFYCYFLLRAVVLNSVGHCAIEVKADNRLEAPRKSESHFYLECEPAAINDLGSKLCHWVQGMSEEFSFEWQNV